MKSLHKKIEHREARRGAVRIRKAVREIAAASTELSYAIADAFSGLAPDERLAFIADARQAKAVCALAISLATPTPLPPKGTVIVARHYDSIIGLDVLLASTPGTSRSRRCYSRAHVLSDGSLEKVAHYSRTHALRLFTNSLWQQLVTAEAVFPGVTAEEIAEAQQAGRTAQ
jgi:hypothetical protein